MNKDIKDKNKEIINILEERNQKIINILEEKNQIIIDETNKYIKNSKNTNYTLYTIFGISIGLFIAQVLIKVKQDYNRKK